MSPEHVLGAILKQHKEVLSFYRQGDGDSESLRYLPKVTQWQRQKLLSSTSPGHLTWGWGLHLGGLPLPRALCHVLLTGSFPQPW